MYMQISERAQTKIRFLTKTFATCDSCLHMEDE